MKFTGAAIAIFTSALLVSKSSAFSFGVLPRNQGTTLNRQGVVLSVSTESSSDISSELSSGVEYQAQDGIRVVDYGSVQDQNNLMERALRDAREIHLSRSTDLMNTSEVENRLMGINDEVVKEVGHEVGNFSELSTDKDLLQKTAALLRAKATPGLFDDIDYRTNKISKPEFYGEEEAKYKALLEKAYDESGEVTSAFAKTFYLGTTLLPPQAQQAIWAIYVWCRRTDEIVDAPRNLGSDELNNAAMLQDLAEWELRLENLWQYGEVVDVLDLPLLDVRKNYPDLSIQPFMDMIRGMLMDIPELGVERYNEWEELHLYCYRVAGTVGLMSMPIFGTKPGVTIEEAKEPALSLGVAFQITNILRDVGEDASTRKRIYLPKTHMDKFNVSEEQLFAQRIDENYRNLVKYEIDMARKYYDLAQEGVYMLSEEGRLPVQTSLDCYRKILDKIEANNYDTLTTRAYVDKWEKLFTIPFSWYRTQEIHKQFPIPEDW